jgi:hypothetical protein
MVTDVFSRQYTISDSAKYLEDSDLVLYDANFHIELYAVKYGSGNNCTAQLTVGQPLFFREINLHKIFFKNATGGSVAKVSVVGVMKV